MFKRILLMVLVFLSIPLYATAAVNLPKTGQNLCYDPSLVLATNTGVITCAGTGQDGETQVGAVPVTLTRFTDNGNGTVTDNLTGLVWLQNAHCAALNPTGGSTWTDALIVANNLAAGAAPGVCGLTDSSTTGQWRLPNIDEMMSLVDLSQTGPAITSGNPFTNFDSGNPLYWSSTITAVFPANAESADMFTGTLRGDVKTAKKYIWPVKGTSTSIPQTGQTACWDVVNTPVVCPAGADGAVKAGAAWPAPRFTADVAGVGTITDNLTGLVWLKQADCIGSKATQAAALTAANGLASGSCGLTDGSVAGDWRLPNRVEMRSLVNYQQTDGGLWLGTQGFTNTSPISGWYWTSDTYASLSDPKPIVTFPLSRPLKWMVKTEGGTWTNDAVDGDATQGTNRFVLPVRGALKTQSIAISNLTRIFGAAPLDLSTLVTKSGASLNAVTFALVSSTDAAGNPASIATLNGTTLTLTGAGSIVVKASQAGNGQYYPAGDTLATITVAKAAATVALSGSQSQTYDGTPKSLTVTTTTTPPGSSVSVTVTYNGIATQPTNAGTYAVVATITDANYQGTAATATLVVTKAAASVSLSGSLSQTYDGTIKSLATTTVPPGVAVTVTYNGAAAPITAGTYAVLASITDPNYQGTAATASLVVAKAPATLTLGSLSQTYTGTAKSATATSVPTGVGVTFTYNGLATQPINAGSYAVVGSITDLNFQGTAATGSLVIAKATATVTLGSLSQTYDGTAKSATATTVPAGKTVNLSYTPANPVNAGTYAVVGTISDANYTGTANGSLVVGKRTPTVTWSTPAAIVSGTALSATQLNATASVPGTFVYTPAAGTVPTAGSRTLSVAFTPTDAVNNTGASATVTLAVTPTFAVTFVPGSNGSLTGVTTQAVASGGSTTPVTAVPATGYHFVQWTGPGTFTSTSNPLTVSNVTAIQALTASFAVDTFLVTGSAPGGNGSISCSSPVNYGANSICTVTPNAGFHLITLTDNGADGMSTVSGSSYTMSGVTGNHVVSVGFARPTGILTPVDGSTLPLLGDAQAVLRMALDPTTATPLAIARADVAPLGPDGKPLGDGKLDIYDVIGILRIMLGLN